MVGSQQPDKSGDILVEFDYNNIIVVDPNKTIDYQGNVSERLVDHENLIMYANLEAEVLPRTKLAVGASPEDRISNVSIARIDFLKPNRDNVLTTNYYDELSGANSTQGKGENQSKETSRVVKDKNGAYTKFSMATANEPVDNGLLGITSINVRINTSFIPSVTMELEDVQGRALFQLGDQSPYAAFFNLPYPPFYLTLKGYYGKAVRYQLNLIKFNARFNSFSGNYQVSLEFVGYKFNILNEISLGHLLATPHMYSKTFNVSKGEQQVKEKTQQSGSNQVQQEPTNAKDTIQQQVVTERGYQKIVEVYSEYKSKGLIPPDFPEITLAQLMNRLEMFEQTVINNYPKADVEPLTNCRTYKANLTKFYQQVIGGNNSWFSKYINPKPLILKDNGLKIYSLKLNRNIEYRKKAIPDLVGIIDKNNDDLNQNKTLGKSGTNPIKNQISLSTFTATTTEYKIDKLKTLQEQTGVLFVSDSDPEFIKAFDKFRKENAEIFAPVIETEKVNGDVFLKKEENVFFIFEGSNRFENQIKEMEAECTKVLGDYETKISADLAKKIEDSSIGLGFKPTVRNFIAVIMASTEGFIRLMDEVHTNAWNVRNDIVRKNAILDNPSSAPSSETKDNQKIADNASANKVNSQQPVYPWPQFFTETPEDKKGRFQLKYIGDPTVVNLTKGYLYEKWPEVEFVEEYFKGLSQKFNSPIAQDPTDIEEYTRQLNINAIEIPNTKIAYTNKEENKYFYEIWERQFLTTRYTGVSRFKNSKREDIKNLIADSETLNIINSLSEGSPYLNMKLKNYAINPTKYEDFLKSISNQGTGRNYQQFIRDFFITPYISSLTNTTTKKSFEILDLNKIGSKTISKLDLVKLNDVIDNVNEFDITDTYPFTQNSWTIKNLASLNTSVNVFETNKSLNIYEPYNVISNFTQILSYDKNRPVTNFSYLKPENLSIVYNPDSVSNFYETKLPDNFVPTEGEMYFDTPKFPGYYRKVGSMMNTPYFINSMMEAADKIRTGNSYPFVSAAYLFLNSLPLTSLRERYKSNSGGVTEELDYIFAAFKKFGAIHKLPYAWILKVGSIWHRYKTYIQKNNDILNNVWKDFNYKNAYDPITNNPSKVYSLKLGNNPNKENIQLEVLTADNQVRIQVGFYPKIISDYNLIYNGNDLYENYSNEEIQSSISNGLLIHNYSKSNFVALEETKNLTFNTWSVLLPSEIKVTQEADCSTDTTKTITSNMIIPSFGTQKNEVRTFMTDYVENQPNTLVLPNVTIENNQSVYNGSIRSFWVASNYGYFDNSQIKKPNYDCYLNKIEGENFEKISPFMLMDKDEYSKIEEIFSVFNKDILDEFENKFLDFCRPTTNIRQSTRTNNIGDSLSDPDQYNENFQLLFREMMILPSKGTETTEDYFNSVINKQGSKIYSVINDFLTYDKIFKFGNPSNYNRRVFDSYLSNDSIEYVVDPINFEFYVDGSLPSQTGTTTVVQSKAQYPNEWKELEIQIGFSTISELVYKDNGSYITDFFIKNNIKFTVDNIRLLSPLIKMYATQLLNDKTKTIQSFKNDIKLFLNGCTEMQDLILGSILEKLRVELPNTEQIPERTIQSVLDGTQSKVELYEVFKALNDKWVAGGDYTTKTLFEDILFLDRASRNIGNTLYLDIFTMKELLNQNSINMSMSVYTFIAGLLIKNNFTIMNLPAYVNFYNVQDVDGLTIAKPEGSLEFANNMWGTFLNVDYRNSSPKMVCFYTGRPSNYLDIKENKNYMFKSDGFELRRASENPLIENQKDKTDWSVSNKCVGFNVDIGIRSQNIFSSFSVSQDNGKATSEAINTHLNIVNQVSGRQASTQNVGIYNLYKQRSYEATVVCLGNALLQPTMYFNLRHVPMFNGPYFITSVNHQIQPGHFETTFTGVRQGIFDLPAIENYLQSINRNLLTKLEKIIKNRKDDLPNDNGTQQQKSNEKQKDIDNKKAANESCNALVKYPYLNEGFLNIPNASEQKYSAEMLASLIKNNDKYNNPKIQATIFALSYISTFKDNQFFGIGNNFAKISLNYDFSPTYTNFFDGTYSCLEVSQDKIIPIAGFNGPDDFAQFMVSRIENVIKLIQTKGLLKFYICYWPKSEITESTFDVNNKNGEYVDIIKKLEDALTLAKKQGVNIDFGDTNTFLFGQVKTNQKGETESNSTVIKCDVPIIYGFGPLSGNSNTPITILGKDFYDVKSVTVGGQNAQILEIIKPTSIKIIPPNNSGKITVTTAIGQATTNESFTYLS